jgi:serine/threonine-protein kinase
MPDTLAHYNLLDRIGTGGLGDVYRARDTKVGRTVALKVLPPGLLADASKRDRFLEAAHAAATLSHPNIATLFDVGNDAGRWYLAYEFVQGTTLRQLISGRAINTRHAIDIAVQLADAVAEAHSRGVLHTDLRPENIVVTGKGSSKILDFGMAAWTRGGAARGLAASSPQSLHGEALGTVAYLSPEQAIGGVVDARTDVFSLGVIVYEMLSGRNPFAAPDPATTVLNVSRLSLPPVTSMNPELPREFDVLLARTMTKDLESRQQSAVSLSAELRSIGAVLDVRTGESAPAELLPLDDDIGGGAQWWIAGLVAIACGAAAIWWFWK